MVRDRTGEFAVSLPGQPLGSAIAVGEPGRLLVAGKLPCRCRAAGRPPRRAADRRRSPGRRFVRRASPRSPRPRASGAGARAGDPGPGELGPPPPGRARTSARSYPRSAFAAVPTRSGGSAAGDGTGCWGTAHLNRAARRRWQEEVRVRWLRLVVGPGALGTRDPACRLKRDLHGAVAIRPQDRRAMLGETLEGRRRGMTVRVPEAGRRDGNSRADRREEGVGRGGATAVVGDLEHLDPRQPASDQHGVDLLFDVAHEQEAVGPDARRAGRRRRC